MPPNTSQRRRPVSWEKDAVDGGPSSVNHILKWLTADGNLQRWRGDTVGGKTKKVLASEIADQIAAAGICGRTYKGVLQKVNDIQDAYNKAADLKRQSGEGILDEDEAKTFHDKLTSICKHWDILDPVFHNRASAKPIAPTGTFSGAQPFHAVATRSFEEDMPDFNFPFGSEEEPKSEEEKENRDGGDAGRMAEDGKASEILIEDDDSENSVCSSPARDNSCTNNTSTHTEEIEADTAQPNQTRQRTTASRASRAAGTTKANGKRAGNSTRSKPLTLKTNPQRKRKRLDDVMYDSICERTSIAKKRSCIEMAQAKVMFTKDLIELGIYTTEEVKAMVTAQFDDN